MKEEIFCEKIYDYGYDGEGICRLNGKVVFVPYCLVGEKVKFKLKEQHSSFCKGELIEVVLPSKDRTTAPCPYFAKCGGCCYQHTSHENELEIKKQLLQSGLKKVDYHGEIDLIASDKEYGYRNKIRLFVTNRGLSLRVRGSGEFCKIDKCLLVSNEINDAISKIDKFLKLQNLFSYYKEVIIRQEGDILLVNFVVENENRLNLVNYQGLYLLLGSNFGIFESFKGKLFHKMGVKELCCKEFGLVCKFSPLSFHQVNDFVGKELYKKVIENVKSKSVINCYSGAGVLSGVLEKAGKRVIAIELGDSEHQDAQRLKEDNKLFFLTNLHGDCGKILCNIDENIEDIIVDPPRAGIDKSVIEVLNKRNFNKLIYISCNSATFLRDVERLKPFKIKEITIFDMFPRTGEYEIMAILEKTTKQLH